MGNICMYPITSILKWKRILLTKWKGKVRKTKYRKKKTEQLVDFGQRHVLV